tara:strand:+ start:32 stop:1264 length:1233 start_codon:yes stop_codon:yes gene_type:complete
MQKGDNEPQDIINEMKRKEQTQAFDATDRAAITAAAGSAGAAGYYGAKLGADKIQQKLDFRQAMFEADVDDPFIYQEPPDIPEVEGGFGSPEQRKAASETSAGKRRVQTAVKSQDLFVPEFGPGGERQPGFRHHMKTPGKSNPNLGKMFDYVSEGTVGLMESFENLNDPDVIAEMPPRERAARIDAINNVLEEVNPNRTKSASEGKIAYASYGAKDKPFYSKKERFSYEKKYRQMVADDFGKKIEMGLNNAKRYLDQRQVAKTLARRRPEFMKGAIKSGAAATTIIPDPTDLVMLALAGPYEMMFETGIGKEPGTGTFDIPLASTLGNASRLLRKPLDSRELNEATRLRLAEDDYGLASALFNQDVLSKEAFDHVTGIRKSRGLDTTVPPEKKETAPEPEPAMGRPGRRL